MKALNPSPSLLLSCQEQNTIIILTASAIAATVSGCPLRFLLNSDVQLGEIVQDNMPVTLRIKENTKSFCLHLRFKDSLSVFSSFQVNLFIKQVCCSTWERALASVTFHVQRFQGAKEADINNNVLMGTSDRAKYETYFKSGWFNMLLHNVKTRLN